MLVVDEAGMEGTKDVALLAKAVCRGGGILVCVEDQGQLPNIEAGGGFAAIAARVGQTRLENVTRQQEPWQRDAVRRLSQGEGQAVLEEYARRGHVHVAENRERACRNLVADWKAAGGVEDPKRHVIFVSTNEEVVPVMAKVDEASSLRRTVVINVRSSAPGEHRGCRWREARAIVQARLDNNHSR